MSDEVFMLMNSIYRNTEHNLCLNEDSIFDEVDSAYMAEGYIEKFLSVISVDCDSVKDKELLLERIEEDLIENAWLCVVLKHYRDEVRRNLQLERETPQFEHTTDKQNEPTDASADKYTFNKQD